MQPVSKRCHVCRKPVRKPLEVPVCGDPSLKITVCSKRCRDEYLAGYVETRQGKTVRMLARPHGPGTVLAILWAAYGVVHLIGAPMLRVVDIPLLPPRPGPEFYTGGFAALIVGFAVLRDAKFARIFSAGLATLGLLFSVVAYLRTHHLAYALEGATVFPAALLLSLGEPGPRRALGALALFGLYPTALIVTAATGTFAVSAAEEQVAAESYPGLTRADPRVGLKLSVPSGWYILKEGSMLLPHDGALFRALRPEGRLSVHVYDRPECDPLDPTQIVRVLNGLAADGGEAGMIGDPMPMPVASALGEGRSFYIGRDQPKPQIWYLVFLPWTNGRCVEIRCGGPAAAESLIRMECVQIGARALGKLP
jgi:hypothetical protein